MFIIQPFSYVLNVLLDAAIVNLTRYFCAKDVEMDLNQFLPTTLLPNADHVHKTVKHAQVEFV